jgi:aspartate kinase
VATPERLRQVACRIAETARSGSKVVVVVSAMGKTTDELLALCRSVCGDSSLGPPRRELDMLLSCGERISMALLAMALHDLGVPAISFTGSQSGILTNDRHSGARIIEVRPVRIQDELERGLVVIVAGFQGMSYKREITTLGRGGSDTTAVALTAALGAECCEIYSDVDGVYSADPRIVPTAVHIESLSYPEMQELSGHGAKVLNAQAVEWAQRAGIIIYARKTTAKATAKDDTEVRQTRIGPLLASASPRAGRATAVTSSERLVSLSARCHGGKVLSALREEGVTLRELRVQGLPDGEFSLEGAFVRDDLPDFERTLRALRQAAGAELGVHEEHGSVTAVGPGIGDAVDVLLAVDEALRAAGLSPQRYSTSPLRLTVTLPHEQVRPATVLTHELLCRHDFSVEKPK